MSKKNNYHDVAFWEQRYKQNICQWYEWLVTPNQMAQILEKNLKKTNKLLQLGCGSSNLAQKLIALHHESITCIDFSKQVIKNKQKQSKEGVTYKYHDITQPLPFEQESFDAIIEKNTLDCLFCYEDFPIKVMKAMKQCYRVLKNGGIMISISHGKKKTRQFFYRNRFSPFSLRVQQLSQLKPSQNPVFVYILTKGIAQENQSCKDNEQNHQNGGQLQVNDIQDNLQRDDIQGKENQNQEFDEGMSPEQSQNEQNYEFNQQDGS